VILNRRVITVLVSIIVLSLAFFACTGKKAQDETTLVVWWWGEQEAPGLQIAMDEIAALFNEADNGLKVKLVLQESESLYTAFRVAAQSGKAPDIQFFWGGTQALEDVWLGNCLPLSDYMPKSELDQLPPDQAAETFWNGKQWGWPYYQLGTIFAYNKKMFAEAGADPNNPPKTWDEFIDVCQKLKDKGYTPIGFGAKDEYLGGWLVSYFGQQNWDSNKDLIKMLKGETKASDPKNMEWLRKVEELKQKGFVNEDVLSLDLYQGQDLFAAGKVAMTIHPQSLSASCERTMGADVVGIMPQPSYGSGKLAYSVGIPVQVFTITKDCKVPEKAVEFLKFLHTEEVMKLIYDKAAVVTPDKRFKAEWLTTEVDKAIEKLKVERPLYWMQYMYPFEYERIGVIPAIQQVLGGTATAAAAAKYLDDALVSWRTTAPEQLEAFDKF
jgi:multiple sugar transport system substrate-binding protein